MTSRSRLLTLLVALAPAACTGTLSGTGETPDPMDESDAAPGGPDGGAAPGKAMAGMVYDFFDGTPLAGVELSTDGLTPPLVATSAATGEYVIEGLPDTEFAVRATMAPNYRPTVNPSLSMIDQLAGTPLQRDVMVVSTVGAQRQHSTVMLAVLPDTSIVIGELLTGEGLPKEGIPLANITLTDAGGLPVGEGPYFVGALGDVDPLITTSTAFGGHARVVFLNVPAGEHVLSALFGAGSPILRPIHSLAGGAVIETVQGGAGGGMM
jgi:hypothetical protein